MLAKTLNPTSSDFLSGFHQTPDKDSPQNLSDFISALSALQEENIPEYLFQSGFEELHNFINNPQSLNNILNEIPLPLKSIFIETLCHESLQKIIANEEMLANVLIHVSVEKINIILPRLENHLNHLTFSSKILDLLLTHSTQKKISFIIRTALPQLLSHFFKHTLHLLRDAQGEKRLKLFVIIHDYRYVEFIILNPKLNSLLSTFTIDELKAFLKLVPQEKWHSIIHNINELKGIVIWLSGEATKAFFDTIGIEYFRTLIPGVKELFQGLEAMPFKGVETFFNSLGDTYIKKIITESNAETFLEELSTIHASSGDKIKMLFQQTGVSILQAHVSNVEKLILILKNEPHREERKLYSEFSSTPYYSSEFSLAPKETPTQILLNFLGASHLKLIVSNTEQLIQVTNKIPEKNLKQLLDILGTLHLKNIIPDIQQLILVSIKTYVSELNLIFNIIGSQHLQSLVHTTEHLQILIDRDPLIIFTLMPYLGTNYILNILDFEQLQKILLSHNTFSRDDFIERIFENNFCNGNGQIIQTTEQLGKICQLLPYHFTQKAVSLLFPRIVTNYTEWQELVLALPNQESFINSLEYAKLLLAKEFIPTLSLHSISARKKMLAKYFPDATRSTSEEYNLFATIIQRAYRIYLKNKHAQVRLPSDLFQSRLLETQNNPDLQFLFKNLTSDDYFLISKAGGKLFAEHLKRGEYRLLEFYLNKNENLLPYLFEAYFKGYCAEPTLEFVNSIHSLTSMLSLQDYHARKEKIFGKRAHCFPILNSKSLNPTADIQLSNNAKQTLVKYLENVLPHPSHKRLLKEFSVRSPLSERFFVLIKFSKFFQLISIKSILTRLLSDIQRESMSVVEYYFRRLQFAIQELNIVNEKELSFWNELNLFIQKNSIEKNLAVDILSKMDDTYPYLRDHNEDTNFYLQLISADISPIGNSYFENKRVQILVSTMFLREYSDFIYGIDSPFTNIKLYPGFGIFTSSDIAAASKEYARIIALSGGKTIQGYSKVHGAILLLQATTIHDVSHWRRMRLIPIPIYNGLIAWAGLIEKITGFSLSRITYRIYDMDFAALDRDLDDVNDFNKNIKALQSVYEKNILDALPLEYHLILVFEMLRNPEIAYDFFAHCKNIPEDFLDNFLKKLCESEREYKRIKAVFDPKFSTTLNVFFYLLREVVDDKKLNATAEKNLIALVTRLENVFKWTRNDGLKIVCEYTDKEDFMYVKYIDEKIFTTVISALNKLAQIQGKTVEPEPVKPETEISQPVSSNPAALFHSRTQTVFPLKNSSSQSAANAANAASQLSIVLMDPQLHNLLRPRYKI